MLLSDLTQNVSYQVYAAQRSTQYVKFGKFYTQIHLLRLSPANSSSPEFQNAKDRNDLFYLQLKIFENACMLMSDDY